MHKYSQLKIHIDGGSRGNPGPAACAFVVLNENDEIAYQSGKLLGVSTNNQAEYNGVIIALEWLLYQITPERNPKSITILMDSQLVVNQLNHVYRVKHPLIKPLFEQTLNLLKQINPCPFFVHVPREKNFQPDKLLNNLLDSSK